MTTTASRLELTVVMPAYNEAANIAAVVREAVVELERRRIRYEIVVVDDGSRDDTARVLDGLRRRTPALNVLRHWRNRGYGAAIRSGLDAARGGHVLISDGDGQFRIGDVDLLWNRRFDADVVLGYRDPRSDPCYRRLAGWLYGRVLIPLLFGSRFRDVNCGYKLMTRRILGDLDLRSAGALISAEILTRARLGGATFLEVGVPHYPRTEGRATGLLPRVVLGMLREAIVLRGKILARADCRRTLSARKRTTRDQRVLNRVGSPARLRAGYDPLKSAPS